MKNWTGEEWRSAICITFIAIFLFLFGFFIGEVDNRANSMKPEIVNAVIADLSRQLVECEIRNPHK